jgi:ABC-3C protein
MSEDNMARKGAKPTDVSTRKSAQVPGQYLGYSLQSIRLLELALDAQPGSTLSIEVFEDVGLVEADGRVTASQTKTALGTNPISDRAVDFWKTFSNWLTAISTGQLPISGTLFEIYLAKKRTGKLAGLFHAAKTEKEATDALAVARETLWGKSPTYLKKAAVPDSLALFVNHVLAPNSSDAIALVCQFQLATAKSDPLRDLRPKVAAKWVRPESVDLVIQHAHGWIKERIDGQILEGKLPVLSVDDFNKEIASFLPRCDFRQILVAMAGELELSESTIAAHQLRTYVRQLYLVQYPEEDVIESINDFLRASAERAAWSKAGLVHDDSFDDYEQALLMFWKNKKKVSNVINKGLADIERGQLLLAECCVHQQKLQGLDVPPFFTPGSFHALAEERTVGWHPDYANLLKS